MLLLEEGRKWEKTRKLLSVTGYKGEVYLVTTESYDPTPEKIKPDYLLKFLESNRVSQLELGGQYFYANEDTPKSITLSSTCSSTIQGIFNFGCVNGFVIDICKVATPHTNLEIVFTNLTHPHTI